MADGDLYAETHSARGRNRVGAMAVVLSVALLVASPAFAFTNDWHTVSGNYHGHSVYGFYGTQTYGWTDYNSSAQKHASVDNPNTGAGYCWETTTARRADCVANINVSNIRSHHWGPGITNHFMQNH